MGEPRNIQVFQELVARILNLLYQEFPNPVSVDVKNVGREVTGFLDSSGEEQVRVLNKDSINAMRFLAKEGFLEYYLQQTGLDQPEELFHGSVLTLKGLTLLGAVPDKVNEEIERRPIAEQISDALNDGAHKTVGELVKTIFISALAMGAFAISG